MNLELKQRPVRRNEERQNAKEKRKRRKRRQIQRGRRRQYNLEKEKAPPSPYNPWNRMEVKPRKNMLVGLGTLRETRNLYTCSGQLEGDDGWNPASSYGTFLFWYDTQIVPE